MDPQPLATYSFLDVTATITGPGAVALALGSGSSNAEEGITIEFDEDTDTMQKGADGSIVHSLHAVKSGRVTLRFLKTSPVNSALTQLYNLQRSSSLLHGKNTIVVGNPVTGDNYTCQQVAFAKFPNNTWAKDSNFIEWPFNAGVIDPLIGSLNQTIGA